MGNVNNPSTAGFRGEKITSASYYTRPKEAAGPFNHHGVVVNTAQGNSYLIHSTPKSGTVVTPASNMNKNTWTKSHDIPVNGNKTVGEVFNQSSGRTLNQFVNYGTSGTCIWTAGNAEKALQK